ncbi:MAG: hypothetical protein B7X04_01175 [Parcubacteria group bacterium 21-54-25]|nr:MAG: hypothetical protein B7X04_01175 [Parcubacteria group bacterium 21-54-25]
MPSLCERGQSLRRPEYGDLESQFRSLQSQYRLAFERAKTLRSEATEARTAAEHARTTQVRMQGSVTSTDTVERFLDNLPQVLLTGLKSVTFNAQLTDDIGTPSRAMTQWDSAGRSEIVLGTEPSDRGIPASELLEAALTHEVGHLCYESLDDDAKAEWFALHMETSFASFLDSHDVWHDEIEDFAECFRLHVLAPSKLENHDIRKARFIAAVYACLMANERQ